VLDTRSLNVNKVCIQDYTPATTGKGMKEEDANASPKMRTALVARRNKYQPMVLFPRCWWGMAKPHVHKVPNHTRRVE
jgi:hypothetical protein